MDGSRSGAVGAAEPGRTPPLRLGWPTTVLARPAFARSRAAGRARALRLLGASRAVRRHEPGDWELGLYPGGYVSLVSGCQRCL